MKYIWIPAAVLALAAAAVLVLRQRKPSVCAREQAAREELLNNVQSFSDCFQLLLEAQQEADPALTEKILNRWKKWCAAYPALSPYLENLCAASEDPNECVERWLLTLERWGILHDTPGSTFTVTAEQEALYRFDDVYSPGADARVVRPAWWIQNGEERVCLETGGAEII